MFGNPNIPAIQQHIANMYREKGINPRDLNFIYFFYPDGRPINITPNNIKMYIAQSLGCNEMYSLKFKEISMSSTPKINEWMHSCLYIGYDKMNVKQMILYNGRTMVYVIYAICPAYPNCKVIHLAMDKDVCAF